MGNRSTLCNKQYAVNKYVGTAYDTVKKVSDNIDDVKTVADALGDEFPDGGIGEVANSIDKVITVADNIVDVNTVADNVLEVVEVADNIDAVLDAPNQAELARKWAQEAEDVEVLPSEYSAYHYSKKSEEQVGLAASQVSLAEEQVELATEAADSIGRYQGLWPDTDGSANKGDTYQTQVSGTGTGQYFTALQNTTVEPVGDDVNWRAVVSFSSVSNANLILNSSFEIAGNVANPPDATPRSYNAGDELFQGMFAVGALTGVTYIDGKANGTGQLYTDVYKSEKQKLSTASYVASIANSNGSPVEPGASFVDMGDYWRVTFDMNNTFSVKLEQGDVATGHKTKSLIDIYGHWSATGYVDARVYGLVADGKDGVDNSSEFKLALIDALTNNVPLHLPTGDIRIDHIGDVDTGSYQDNAIVIRGTEGYGDALTNIYVDETVGDYWLNIIESQSLKLRDVRFYTSLSTGAKAGLWRSKADETGETYNIGDKVTPLVHNGFIYTCSGAGKSADPGSEPVWPLVIGSTVVDNEVTWECTETTDYFIGIKMTNDASHHVLDLADCTFEGFSGAGFQCDDLIDSRVDNVNFRKNHIGMRVTSGDIPFSTTLKMNGGYNSANDYGVVCLQDTNAVDTALISSQFKGVISEFNRIGLFIAGNAANSVIGCYGEGNSEFTYFDEWGFTTFIGNYPFPNHPWFATGNGYASSTNQPSGHYNSGQALLTEVSLSSRSDLKGMSASPEHNVNQRSIDDGLWSVKDTNRNKYVGIITPIIAPTKFDNVITQFKCLVEIIGGTASLVGASEYDGWSFTHNSTGNYTIDFGAKDYIKPRAMATAWNPSGAFAADRKAAYISFNGATYNTEKRATSVDILTYSVDLSGTHTPEDCDFEIDLSLDHGVN